MPEMISNNSLSDILLLQFLAVLPIKNLYPLQICKICKDLRQITIHPVICFFISEMFLVIDQNQFIPFIITKCRCPCMRGKCHTGNQQNISIFNCITSFCYQSFLQKMKNRDEGLCCIYRTLVFLVPS